MSSGKNLLSIVTLIDRVQWSDLGIDVQAAAFEGLLEKAAAEGKRGAGQYFTPRPLIESIVRLVQPNPLENADFTISDPACGTGGFLAAAYDWHAGRIENLSAERHEQENMRANLFWPRTCETTASACVDESVSKRLGASHTSRRCDIR